MLGRSRKLTRGAAGSGRSQPLTQSADRSTPLGIWAILAAGYVQASAMLLVGLAADVIPGAKGLVGVDFVSNQTFGPWGITLVGLGFVSLLACAFVWLGQVYGLTALVVTGTLGSAVLAMIGSWVVLVTVLSMTIGVGFFLFGPALDYFSNDDA